MQREMADGFTKRNSMDMLATPLGEWARVREETTGSVFLVGKFLQMPVSVELESADIEQVDFDFIQDKVSKFAQIKRQTELFFEHIARNSPDLLGLAAGARLADCRDCIACPEFAFGSGAGSWSIVYRESVFPIAEPYGILVNYFGDEVVGFEDISDAEEC